MAENNSLKFNVWFNLRLHNNSWADQVDGIVKIAVALRNSTFARNGVHVFLDGTPDCAALADRISKDLAVNSISSSPICAVPLYETIALSTLIDLYVAGVGSGLVIPSWISGRRGVAHSNKPHLAQQSFWNNISQFARDALFLPERHITDLPNVACDLDPGYSNYTIDVAGLLDAIAPLVRQTDIDQRSTTMSHVIDLIEDSLADQAAQIATSF